MRRWRDPAILVLAVLLAGSPALAQPRTPSLAGDWVVEAGPHHASGCVIRGAARATPQGRGAYVLRLDMKGTCPAGGDFSASQRCTARVTGPQVAIACALLETPPPVNYIADTFALEWRADGTMAGRLVDAGQWNDIAVWRRPGNAMISAAPAPERRA